MAPNNKNAAQPINVDAQARESLERLIHVVKTGYLEAETPPGRRLLRRLEGAISALEAQQKRRR